MPQAALNADAFAEMKEIMGDAFREVISMCLQSLPEQLLQVETAIKMKDADALFNSAHKMKSSCGSIGAFGLAEKIESVELIGRSGSTDVPAQTFDELHDAATQVISILAAELDAVND